MASKQSSIFEESDRNLIRLRKMCEAGCTKAMYRLLKWVNPRWMDSMSFKDYLKNEKKVSMKEFNNALLPHQRSVLRDDIKGETYDITLLYNLMLWGNEGLAHKDNENEWKKNKASLEYHITAVKNVRNDLMHNYKPIDNRSFLQRTEELRKLLKDMMNCAGKRYTHITRDEVCKTLQDLDTHINCIRDDPIDPRDFTEYQKCKFIEEGSKALRRRHNNYSSLTPVSRLTNAKFPVGDVFTDMVLKEGSEKKDNLELHYLLEGDNQCITDKIILVEGDAGVGKTTLVRKILNVWVNKAGCIKYLDTYDLVLHAECREHFNSYKELLDSCMPKVSKSFQGNDLKLAILTLKCLVIIDGFDELNKVSTSLFMEILQMKKNDKVTVIVTSRPEAISKYYRYAASCEIGTRHIKLFGIPPERKEEFVKKYYAGMEKTGQMQHDIDGLLKYLDKTEHRLADLWRLPYNLAILTILWAIKPDDINSITTAPELHWKIHELHLSKLEERLHSNEVTRHLNCKAMEKKIEQFIFCLGHVSLKALANDDVTLPEEAYQQLKKTCNEIEIPVGEMVGSFLKQITSASGIRYGYPHKGLQDFLAALFILMKLTAPPENPDIEKIIRGINDTLIEHNVPAHVSQNIRRLTKGELVKGNSISTTTTNQSVNVEKVEQDIESVLTTNKVPQDLCLLISTFINKSLNKDHQNTCQLTPTKENDIWTIIKEDIGQSFFEFGKFRNMLTELIGLFYIVDTGAIRNDTKLEVLDLLQKTGVGDQEKWMHILNSVKCDEIVASYISNEVPLILSGALWITDSSIFAYISLMKALKPPKNEKDVRIRITNKANISNVDELLNQAVIHQFNVDSILMSDSNHKQYTKVLEVLKGPLKDPHQVKVDMTLNEELLDIMDLMFQIKRNNFSIRSLELMDNEILIDKNFTGYATALKSLPTLLENAYRGKITLRVKENIPSVIDELLKEISRRKFGVDIHLLYNYSNPPTNSGLETTLNVVFDTCQVNVYTGVVTQSMRLPRTATKLRVSIADVRGYESLSQHLNSCNVLTELSLYMNHRLASASHQMKPLCVGRQILRPSLFITDIKLKTDLDNAVLLLKTLVPNCGFDTISFPRASMSYEMITELLKKLRGLNVKDGVVFPRANKPSSSHAEHTLQQLAKRTLNCEDCTIYWG